MTEEFLDYYSKNINKESKPKEGLINFLDWAKSINISLSICTNKQEALSKDLIKKLNLSKYFDFIAGSDTFDFNKPDPRHLTNVIEIVGGEKTKSIMIGDSEVDSEASYNAQLPFVLVEDGYTEKNINEIRHDFKIKNFHFLKEIVEKFI